MSGEGCQPGIPQEEGPGILFAILLLPESKTGMFPNISLNRRMPNGTSGGVRGARTSSPYSIGYAPHTSDLLHPGGVQRKTIRTGGNTKRIRRPPNSASRRGASGVKDPGYNPHARHPRPRRGRIPADPESIGLRGRTSCRSEMGHSAPSFRCTCFWKNASLLS